MKTSFIALVATLGLVANGFAADVTPTVNYKQSLSAVSILELPAMVL